MLGIGRRGPLGRDGEVEGGGSGAPHVADPDERAAWVVLAGAHGVGPVSFGRLRLVFGSAAAVLRAAGEPGAIRRLVEASAAPDAPPALTPDAAATIVAAAAEPERALAAVRRSGVAVVTLEDAAYPARLRQIELPPPVLFVRGAVEALSPPRSVAVVGTRRPTPVGRATAGRIAEAVGGHGATVVSGLAYGIDAAAHHAAVRRGRPTVAVIGGGHEHLYPAGHRVMAADIVAAGGAVVSEFAPDTRPTRGTFPRRNRIISGLADATVVVEAGARSGALTTAAWALEQGRGLFLVPGRLDDPAVAGSLAFLREAGPEARVVAGIAELVEDLGLAPATGRPEPVARLDGLGPSATAVAQALVRGAATPDALAEATGLPGAALLAALTQLELRGLAVEVLGHYQPAGALADRHAGPRRPVARRLAGRPAA
jgi:DNA processing protein